MLGLAAALRADAAAARDEQRGRQGVRSRRGRCCSSLSLPIWVALARATGLYSRDEERPEHTTIDDLVGVFQLVTVCVWLIFVVVDSVGVRASPDLGKWVLFWFLAIVFVSGARALARLVARRSPDYGQNAVVVGTDKTGQLLARKIMQHPEFGIDLVGFVDASPRELRTGAVGRAGRSGRPEELSELVERLDLDRVVIGFSGLTDRQLMELARTTAAAGRAGRRRSAPVRGDRPERDDPLARGRASS